MTAIKIKDLGKKVMDDYNAAMANPSTEYERGFVDGMQKQMQSSVDKAVNRMCDGAAGIQPCPHPHNCTVSCQFNDAELPEVHWIGIQTKLVWATWLFVTTILFSLMLSLAFVIGRLI